VGYASYWNVVHNSSGTCLARTILLLSAGWGHICGKGIALHGTESGASAIGDRGARLGMVERRCSLCYPSFPADTFLSTELWQNHWTNASWREYLAAGEMETELASIRQCTHTGRPLGAREFVHALEESMDRRLVPQKGGRPVKPRKDTRQTDLDFGL